MLRDTETKSNPPFGVFIEQVGIPVCILCLPVGLLCLRFPGEGVRHDEP